MMHDTALSGNDVARSPDANRFLTVSNLLSISRALLAVPFVFVMAVQSPPSRHWGAAIMILAAITDKLDGTLARRFRQATEWGRILDPLADKIAVAAVALSLLLLGEIPVWFIAVVIGRDVLILLGGIYVKARRNIVLPSNETGKWAVGLIALTLFLVVLEVNPIVLEMLFAGSTMMLGLSLFFYIKRFVDVVSGGSVASGV